MIFVLSGRFLFCQEYRPVRLKLPNTPCFTLIEQALSVFFTLIEQALSVFFNVNYI